MRNKTQKTVIGLVTTWLALFGVLPILLLIGTSFLQQDPEHFFRLAFSLDSYRQLADPAYLAVMLRSLKLAVVTTLLCLAAGYPFAWYTARLGKKYRTLVLVLLMIPFWTNSLVRTYAIRMLLGTQGILNKLLLAAGLIDSPLHLLYTDLAVILGLFYLMLPFMILPLYANLEKLDFRLVEAGRDLGAGFLQISRKSSGRSASPGSLPAASWFSFRPWASSTSPPSLAGHASSWSATLSSSSFSTPATGRSDQRPVLPSS